MDLWGCFGWRHDPGPCPVDDTPHTACTPESVAKQKLTVPVRRPRTLDASLAAAARQLTPPAQEVVEFTTATYRRALHHPARPRKKKP